MKSASADGQNQSTKTEWPRVPKIAEAEFEQSVAVAKLALKLCEVQKRELQNKWEAEDRNYAHDIQTAVTESEKKRVNEERSEQMKRRMRMLDPKGFVDGAWQLIEKAREHVLREQSNAEYLAAHAGSHEAAEKYVERVSQRSRVAFKELCDPERNKGDTELIYGMHWKVFTTARGFDDLFWAYWCAIGEKWKAGDQEIGTVVEYDTNGNRRRLNFYSEDERKQLAILASDKVKWEQRGQLVAKTRT